MNKFINSFKKKSFRYGTFSAITAAVVIVVLIVINLIFSQLDLKWDLTKEKRYSISDESREILGAINEKVTVYALFKTGQEGVVASGQPFESEIITELLNQYKTISKNIEIVYKDPYLYPDFVQKYSDGTEGIPVGSLIVEKGDSYKVIAADQLYSVGYDDGSSTYGIPQAYLKSIDLEPKLTNAIKQVAGGEFPVIYYVAGHGEYPISSHVEQQLDSAGYELKEFNTFDKDSVPEDCSVLIMTQPSMTDYTAQEAELIKSYLAADGRALIITGINLQQSGGFDFPNFEGIMSNYGVQAEKKFIFEADPDYLFNNSEVDIIPKPVSSEITVDSANQILIYGDGGFFAHPIAKLPTKNSTKIESILSTSKKSVSTSGDMSDAQRGPFDLGVAITDSTYTDTNHSTKLVVLSSLAFLDDTCDFKGGNSAFVVSSVSWLNDAEDNVYIEPKNLVDESYIDVGTAKVKYTILVICCVVIPLGLLVTGFVIWLRRRNK